MYRGDEYGQWGGRSLKKAAQCVFFVIFLILGIGQMPTMPGRLFLLMALLAVPIKQIRCFVDEMLALCSHRAFWLFLLFRLLFALSETEIVEAGKQMGKFLRGLLTFLGML